VGALTFNSAGAINTGATTLPFAISRRWRAAATTPQAFNLDFTGSTQFGSAFGVNQISQDGYGSGHLSGFSVGADGVVQGATATADPQAGRGRTDHVQQSHGLATPWSERLRRDGKIGRGRGRCARHRQPRRSAIRSTGSSNVDLTAELVNMITRSASIRQRGRAIKTEDQILQTLVSLR